MRAGSGSPPIDHEAFELLRREIDDDECCATFLEIYLDLLPQRVSELSHAVANGEIQPWDAAINLAATTRMIGAMPLAEHLERLSQDSIVTRSPEAIRIYLRRLVSLTRTLQPALRQRINALQHAQDKQWQHRHAHRS